MILILGRFQPIHNGHIRAIKEAVKIDPELIIAIGSATKENLADNPFSAKEREDMIKLALNENNIKARIAPVPNIPSDNNYVEHVESCINTKPNKILTENPWTIKLFAKSNYTTIETPRFDDISASNIRKRILENDDWESLLPNSVSNYIKQNNLIKKLKEIYKK